MHHGALFIRTSVRGLGLVALSVTVAGCVAITTPSPSPSPEAPINVVEPSLPPPDPDSLEPGLGWAAIYDVELPGDAFRANPSPTPIGVGGPGLAGHPGHFPGQAVMADVVAAGERLLAVGYVGDPWTAIAWSSSDGFSWTLETIDAASPSFAMSVDTSADGTIVAVGRHGPAAAAWFRLGDTWQRAEVVTDDGDATRMTVVLATGGGWVGGGSIGPELGDREARFWTSSDGRTWVPSEDGQAMDGAEVVDILELDGRLVALGRLGTGQRGSGTIAWTSDDGRHWERVVDPELAEGLAVSMTSLNGAGLVAVGSDLDERAGWVWHSRDGNVWQRVPDEDSRGNRGYKIHLTDVVGTAGGLVAIGDQVVDQFGFASSWLSEDGRTWTKSDGQPSLGQSEPLSVVVTDRYLVAVGSRGAPDNRIPTVWLSGIPGE
jgi:hypothetical protein